MNLQNTTFITHCTPACCEEWLFLTTPLGSGAQSASKCRGILSPTLSSLRGGEGEAAASRWLSCLIQRQCGSGRGATFSGGGGGGLTPGRTWTMLPANY